MQELTREQIAEVEAQLKNPQYQMKKVKDFINQPVTDKNGNSKPLSMFKRTEYVADALDELHERIRNTLSMHVYQIHCGLSDLHKQIEKIKERLDKIENSSNEPAK